MDTIKQSGIWELHIAASGLMLESTENTPEEVDKASVFDTLGMRTGYLGGDLALVTIVYC